MRPYDPESAEAANPTSPANDATRYNGEAEMYDANPAAQPVDYTYNSSLEVADTIDTDMVTPARVSVGDSAVGGGNATDDVYPASSTLPPGTRDVTPASVSAEQSQEDKAKKTDGVEKTDETEAIRADIEQTRTQMSATIDAIQEKLNPQNIVDQAKGAVREATIGRVENMVSEVRQTAQEASSGFLDTIKDNPIPTAMAAVGLGWLFMKSRNKDNGYGGYH